MNPIVEMSRDGDHRGSLVAGLETAIDCLSDTESGRDRSTILITVRKYQLDIMEYDEKHPQAKQSNPLMRAQERHRSRANLKVVGE